MSIEYIPGLEDGTAEDGEIKCDAENVKIDVRLDTDARNGQISRTEIMNFGNEGFLLHNLMSEKECSSIIDEGERAGFGSIRGAQDNYRSAQRIMVESPSLADQLWTRIQPYLEDIEIDGDPHDKHIHGIPFVIQGKWIPCGLNKLFRLCRYYPDGHFAPHFDGFYEVDSQHRSLKTLMIYLNGDFAGGSTNFVDEKQTLYKDESGKYCAEEKNILCRIKPETGMAILFNHHRLHEGQKLGSNKKYILRTDIMYKKVDENKIDDKQERALAMLKQAEELEALGKCAEAADLYRKAFKLSPTLEQAMWG